MIIAIDGLDGSGKETLCNEISKKLMEEYGWYMDSVFIHSFPDYTIPSGKMIDEILHGGGANLPKAVRPYMLATLFSYNRAEHFRIFEMKVHDKDFTKVHLFDRYWASNLIYQGLGMSYQDMIHFMNFCIHTEKGFGNPEPDFYYFLQVPYSVLRKRIDSRKNKDKYEEDVFQKAVYHMSEWLLDEMHIDYPKAERAFPFHYTETISGIKYQHRGILGGYEIKTPEEIAQEIILKTDEYLKPQGLSLLK